jgi:hypothetical protein
MDYATVRQALFTAPPDGVGVPEVVATAAPARRLRDALEPLAMHAVWSPRTNAALAERGLDDFLTAYLCGRAAPLGEVPSAVVAATFAVFEPTLVDQLWTAGRARIGLDELIEVRDRATADSLREVLAPVTGEDEVSRVAATLEDAAAGLDATGRVLFAAVRARPRLADPYARLWRAADVLREHRGDSHVAACVAAGLDPVRMNVMTEAWVGYPVGEYSGTRAWPAERQAAAVAGLENAGLLADGSITAAGRAFRDRVEDATDAGQAGVVEALGSGIGALTEQLDAWSKRCVEGGAFPPDIRKRAAG